MWTSICCMVHLQMSMHSSQLALRTASVVPICSGDLTVIASYNRGQLESKEMPAGGELQKGNKERGRNKVERRTHDFLLQHTKR